MDLAQLISRSCYLKREAPTSRLWINNNNESAGSTSLKIKKKKKSETTSFCCSLERFPSVASRLGLAYSDSWSSSCPAWFWFHITNKPGSCGGAEISQSQYKRCSLPPCLSHFPQRSRAAPTLLFYIHGSLCCRVFSVDSIC